jgi:hypothetical protein
VKGSEDATTEEGRMIGEYARDSVVPARQVQHRTDCGTGVGIKHPAGMTSKTARDSNVASLRDDIDYRLE